MQTIILTSKPDNTSTTISNVSTNIPMGYDVTNSEIALSGLFIYYSWFNVEAKRNNNTFGYRWLDGTFFNITVPDGMYSIDDLNSVLQYNQDKNGHYLLDNTSTRVYFLKFQVNTTYYGVTVTSNPLPPWKDDGTYISSPYLPTGWTNPNNLSLPISNNGATPQLNINNASFGKLIGFNTGMYPANLQSAIYQKNSDFPPQISPTNIIHVCCNLANSGGLNKFTNIIYSFTPNTTFGSQIVINPTNLLFFPIMNGRYTQINVSFVDDDYNPIQIRDKSIIANLTVRRNTES